MITIIADEGEGRVGAELSASLAAHGIPVHYISLADSEVKPCINCGGCTYQTYNRCVFRDDGDAIYPKVIQADVLIFVTPVVFGGYSFPIKRIFDKMGLLMDRHYFIEDGEMVKGGRGRGQFRFFAVGLTKGCDEEEIKAFEDLFHENLVITRGEGKTFFTKTALSDDMKQCIVSEVEKI